MRRLIWLAMLFVGTCFCAQAQWLNEPTPGAPRTSDGKVNMTGPVPRVNGKPDLSGIWRAPRNSPYARNIAVDLKPGEMVDRELVMFKVNAPPDRRQLVVVSRKSALPPEIRRPSPTGRNKSLSRFDVG